MVLLYIQIVFLKCIDVYVIAYDPKRLIKNILEFGTQKTDILNIIHGNIPNVSFYFKQS